MIPADPLIVVLDTNVLLPLLVGRTRRALALQQAWRDRQFFLVVTPPILDELERVLHYPRVRRNLGLTAQDIENALDTLRRLACFLPGLVEGVTAVQADPSDNIFLACALEAGADYLVSQDAHLLNLKHYHGTQIVSLAQFAALLYRLSG